MYITVYIYISLGVDAFNNWEYTVIYKPFNSSDSGNSSSTRFTSLTFTSLTPGTVYQFIVTATGPGGSKTTAETYVFSTYGTGIIFICTYTYTCTYTHTHAIHCTCTYRKCTQYI